MRSEESPETRHDRLFMAVGAARWPAATAAAFAIASGLADVLHRTGWYVLSSNTSVASKGRKARSMVGLQDTHSQTLAIDGLTVIHKKSSSPRRQEEEAWPLLNKQLTQSDTARRWGKLGQALVKQGPAKLTHIARPFLMCANWASKIIGPIHTTLKIKPRCREFDLITIHHQRVRPSNFQVHLWPINHHHLYQFVQMILTRLIGQNHEE